MFASGQRHIPSEAISWPTGHQTDRRVRRPPLAIGRNSRNKAPSTGKLPPTPRPTQAKRAQDPIQLGAAPAATPKTLAMPRVQLNASRRPTTSDMTPQKEAPMQRPRKSARVVYRIWLESTPYSSDKEGSVNATPWSQRLDDSVSAAHVLLRSAQGTYLSASHPKPQSTNRDHWYRPIPMSASALLMTLLLPGRQ